MRDIISRHYQCSFASDNNAGVHPAILSAMHEANTGHVIGYGDDPWTRSAQISLKEVFGENTDIFFVFNGTGANVSALASVTRSFHAIICPESAHINLDECCAPERFTGCKICDVPTSDGKLDLERIRPLLSSLGDEHQAQPRVLSITEATEYGTTYRPAEIRKLADFAHDNEMLLHMDGARLANAAAFLGCSLSLLTREAGVDILSFGGTKNGMMYGEAVIFFDPDLSVDYQFFRKQSTQLASKMRYIAVQFETIMKDGLWFSNAAHANNMAELLAQKVSCIEGVSVVYPVEANAVFVTLPLPAIRRLQEDYFFYIIDEQIPIVRWMTSFDTGIDDVKQFAGDVLKAVSDTGENTRR